MIEGAFVLLRDDNTGRNLKIGRTPPTGVWERDEIFIRMGLEYQILTKQTNTTNEKSKNQMSPARWRATINWPIAATNSGETLS